MFRVLQPFMTSSEIIHDIHHHAFSIVLQGGHLWSILCKATLQLGACKCNTFYSNIDVQFSPFYALRTSW
jgi:hypothetical protein